MSLKPIITWTKNRVLRKKFESTKLTQNLMQTGGNKNNITELQSVLNEWVKQRKNARITFEKETRNPEIKNVNDEIQIDKYM